MKQLLFSKKAFQSLLLSLMILLGVNKMNGQTSPQTFSTTGTWTCPAGVTSVQVECWGAGGAGGSAVGSTSFRGSAGGGAGGAYSINTSISVTPGTVYTVTVGAGGIAPAAGFTNGATSPGSDSWFSTAGTIIAKGGAGGASVNASSANLLGTGGVGTTTGSNGSTSYKGGDGYTSLSYAASTGYGGGGGASAGTGSAGTSATSKTGATAVAGGGAGGTGGTGGAAGTAALANSGGGGGGAQAASSTTNRLGGNGGSGKVIITWSTPTPVISTTGALVAVNTTYGTASASPTSFSVSGANMTAGILVTPPAGYQVCLTSTGTYTSTLTVSGTGTIASTTVYVRLSSTATVASSPYSGNIALSSSGATGVNVATASSTVTAKALTISGLSANNKLYDGNTSATLSGTAALVGVVNSDVVTLGGTPVATFATSTAGTGIALTVTGYSISGAGSGNYTVTQPTGLIADITSTPTPVISSTLTASGTYGTVASTYTITASNSPTSYNATGLPTGLSINTANGQITGTPTAVPGNFNVTISATNGGGTGNATLVYTIAAKTLTISGAAVTTKNYDASSAATITGTLTGVVGSDDVTFASGTSAFANANVGTGITVTSNCTLNGAANTNYSLTQPTGLTGAITKANSSITTAPTGTNITIGNALSTSTLSGGVGLPAAGTFAFTSPTTVPSSLGTASYAVTYTPTDTANYNTSTTTVNVTVVNGPTTLVAGDIAIVSINSANPDKFAIVLLKSITAGTVINFTDNGFTGTDTSGRTGEGFLTYTAPSDLPFGTVLTWTNAMTIPSTGNDSGWSSNAPTNFSFNGAGDQLFIFQGATANWAAQTGITLLYGLNYGVALSATSSASNTVQPNTSIMPATAFLNLGSSTYANGYFSNTGSSATSVSLCGTPATILSAIVTSSKWVGTTAAIATFPTYTFTTPCPTPVITGTATATAFTTTYGTASTAQTFTIGGSNLTTDLIATAPTGFEVASDGTTYGSTTTFTQSGGSASGTISIRLKASAAVSGAYNTQTITLTSSGATTVNITTAASGNTVAAKDITISVSANNKAYDGTTSAALGTPAYVGLANGETISVSGTATANFADANVGTGKTVTISGYSAPNANYTLTTQPSAIANITTVALTITGLTANNKSYDTTTAVTLNTTLIAYSGLVNSESFSVSGTPTAAFVSANAGTAVAVTISGYTAPSANYTLSAQPTTTANITAVSLTITGLTANNKSYNGNTTATLSGTPAYEGLVNGQTFSVTGTPTATFASVNVGTGIGITISGYTPPTSNYTLSAQPTGLTANITTKEVTISGLSVINKQYDATTTATLSGMSTLVGVVSGDNVILEGTYTADFTQSSVGTGIAVNVSGYSISGTAASNYTLTQPALFGDITSFPTPVITSVLTANATYGALAAEYTITATNNTTSFNAINLPTGLSVDTASGVISGTPSSAPGVYSITISATNLGGTTTASLAFTISPKSLTVTGAVAANKIYDSSNSASITGSSLPGVVLGDNVTVIATGTFDSKNVGTGKTVNITYSLDGTDAAKYTLANTIETTTANITALALTIASPSVSSKVYNATAIATITGSLATPINGDTVSYSSGTSSFASANVGLGITVISNCTLNGADAGNYSLTQPTDLTGNITAASVTISGLTGVNKVYDGTTTAAISGMPVLSGIIGNENVSISGTPTATFATAAVGTGKPITVTGYTLSGADAGNYSLSQPTGLTASITISSQTITFGTLAPKYSNDAAFDLTATASSGLTVTYTSSNTAVATVTGSTITIIGIGTSTITASQAGNTNYSAATSVQQTLAVSQTPFTQGNLVVARVGATGQASAPANGVGTAVFLSEFKTDGTTGITVSLPTTTTGSINRIVESGTATSEAQLSLSTDGQYLTLGGYDASPATASANGTTINRVIARVDYLGSVATTPIGLVHTSGFRSVTSKDGSRFWTAGNGTGVTTIPFAGSATTVVAPTVVSSTATNLRTVSIFGNQLYFSTGSTATPGIGIIQVGTGLPTASPQTLVNKMAGGDPYAYYMVNRGGSNWNCYVAYATGTGIYKWSSSDDRATWTAQGSVSTTIGTYGIVAQVNGSNVDVYATTTTSILKLTDTAVYNATISGTASTIVTAPTNTFFRGISFAPVLIAPSISNSVLIASGTVNTVFANYTITAANSPASFNATGLPTGLSINTTTGVISGTPTVAGTFTVTISATNAAGTDSKTVTITITKANQVITFGALATKDIATTASFELTATSTTSSVNPITYTSSNLDVATISGSTVILVGSGQTTIIASQAGNANYNAATNVSQTLNVIDSSKTDQTITFNTLTNVVYGDAPFALNATTTASGLSLYYQSSNPSVATVSGSTVTIVGIGTTTITALQSGDATYNPAANVSQDLTVVTKQLTVVNAIVTTKPYDGTTTATITDATLSGIVGSDVVTVSGNGTFADANVATAISVTSAFILGGTNASNYTIAQPSLTGTIVPASQTITFSSLGTKSTLEPDFILSAYSATALTNTISYSSSNTTVATIVAGVIHIVGAGTTTITASQGSSSNYNATTTSQVLTIAKGLYLNQFTGVPACPTNGNVPLVNANTIGQPLTRNTITCNSTGNVFNSLTLNATATISNTSYIEFSVAANTGYALKLSSVSFFRQASASAPNQLEVRYSTDNFATYTTWGAAPLSPVVGDVITWNLSNLVTANGGTVTFRLYPYGTQRVDLATSAASTTGTFRVDDVTVFGSVVPAPTSAVLSGTATVCNGNSTDLSVAITGGTAPYSVVYSDGISNTTLTDYSSNTAISVNPSVTRNFNLVSVTDANNVLSPSNTGTATVTVNDNVTYYADTDGDTYGNSAVSTLSCTGAPTGYVLDNTDCDDSNANAHSSFPFYADTDGDGYGAGTAISLCAVDANTPPTTGYVTNSSDCAPSDSSIHTSFPFYVDTDGDGYGIGSLVSVCALNSTTPPTGYSVNALDCAPNDSTMHTSYSFYADTDGDGYGAGSLVTGICAVNADTAPVGYSVNNSDCAPNDSTMHTSYSFYADTDGDGYGAGALVTGICAVSSTTAPVGYSVNASDCDDTDASLYPNSVKSVWTGAAGTAWADSGNWKCGNVPTATSDVTIASGVTNQPVIISDLTINSLTVQTGMSLTVPTGFDLTVTDFVHNNGTMTVQNNANLIQTNDVANTGNITVNRNSSLLLRLDHTLWSSPVTGSQTLLQFSPNTLANRFYTYTTSSNSYTATPATSTFTAGKGFAIRASNTHSSTTPTAFSGTFVGVPNNGSKSFTLATDAVSGYNYNLVGNPYPSTIDVTAFLNGNSNVVGTIYYYTHSLTMNAQGLFPQGTNYSSRNRSGHTVSTHIDGDLHPQPTAPIGTIQVGQGFLVRATNAGTVTFTNAMRTGNNDNQFLRTAEIEKHRIWLNLKTDTGSDINQMMVGYVEGATQAVDTDYDGLLLGVSGSSLASKLDGANYGIQGRSLPFASNDVVPLAFKASATGNYMISLTETDGLFAGSQDIFVRDNLMGTDHNIKVSPYTFASDAGTFDSRFELVYTQALGIPSTDFTPNSVIVYKNTDWFHVNTKGIVMKDIQVYDVAGRLIYKQSGINATTTVLTGLTQTNEVLFLKITSEDNVTVTVKVIN